MPGLCRDCLTTSLPPGARRCSACGSPRLIVHDELFSLQVAHVDCDAFYATIEKRDRPELRDQPLVIGGGRRGVVAAACYIARRYGVRSAMPMFKARVACPHAQVVRPNMAKYQAVGRDMRALMRAVTPLVEPLSIDEAFLDFRGQHTGEGEAAAPEPPALQLARLALRAERELGITISVGLGANKFLAKMASDLDKPRGFAVIGRAEARAFLATKPVGMIFGVGRAMRERLEADGIRRIGQLCGVPPAVLEQRYGSFGERLAPFCRGVDRRSVRPSRPTKSISNETTFEDPIAAADALSARLEGLCGRVAGRLEAQAYRGQTVVLKLKTAGFQILTRSHTLAEPTASATDIFIAAETMLRREATGMAFRLIGVGVSNLVQGLDGDDAALWDEARP
ncbi:MAG: DNA polymerase IV [Alphaproteobacteria bacterium]|nr:DNA polymerase IV [Alphaproteobacteria bacterium]MCB9929859.1 DNA polymerase IV [Alphaproteobacteria bacterium]